MSRAVRFIPFIAVCLSLGGTATLDAGHTSPAASDQTRLSGGQGIVVNAGQWDDSVLAWVRGRGISLWLTRSGVLLDAAKLRQPVATVASPGDQVAGIDRDVVAVSLGQMQLSKDAMTVGDETGEYNFILGADSEQWISGVPMVSYLACEEVFPGIDLILSLDSGLPSFDFVAIPGADLAPIQFRADIPQSKLSADVHLIQVEGDFGTFSLRTTGDVIQDASGLTLKAGHGGQAQSAGASQTISATIDYGTFLGGTQYDVINGMALADDGSIVVVGNTESANFPTSGAYDPTYNGGSFGDVFITRFTPDGSGITYSTFIGGANADISSGIVMDSDDGPIITGITGSLGTFPLFAGYDSTYAGAGDGFVLKLNASGASIAYSTLIGGINEDYPRAIAVDASGSVYITGHTRSVNFPAVGVLDTDFNGGAYDAFVSKLSSAGSVLSYSGYVGGSLDDQGFGIGVDAIGRAHIRGWTVSANFPTINAFDNSFNGGDRDAFLARVSASGAALEYSTYLGGVGSDYGVGLVVDDSGCVYLGGVTRSGDFPIVNAHDNALGGSQDLYLTKFDSSGQALVFSTYLGGSGEDFNGLATVDNCGHVFMTGYTYSTDFPMILPDDSTFGGGSDLVLTGFSADGSQLTYSSFVGGADFEFANAIIVRYGNAYVAGVTNSADFPIIAPYADSIRGDYDGFITVASGIGVNDCGCICECAADPTCDGIRSNIQDVVRAINVAFRGAPAVIDPSPTCLMESTDANCSGSTDVIDVVKFIGVAFRGTNPATEYCDPCQL